MKKVDMSEAAILRRLRTVDQLRELCLSLMDAKKKSDEKKKNPINSSDKTNTENSIETPRIK